MRISQCTLFIGIIFLILAIIQWNLHAKDGWIGEKWDSDEQENLYYNIIAPMFATCMVVTPILIILGI